MYNFVFPSPHAPCPPVCTRDTGTGHWTQTTGSGEQGTALSSPSKCSDLPTTQLMLGESDMPLWDNYGARFFPRLIMSDKIFFHFLIPTSLCTLRQILTRVRQTIMRYIWDVEDVSQWLEPINISHLMNILWKQCWLETCGAQAGGALLLVMSGAGPAPRPGSSPEIRCSVIRVSSAEWAVSSDVSHRGPGHQATLVNTTLLTFLARPGGSVLLGTPDSNIRESQRAASCDSSLSDLGPHQWPGDWFNDIPLHTSIHYHWTSPPRTPHIAWWI